MNNLNDFYIGKMFNAYEYFGAHPYMIDDIAGVMFRVYAPSAVKIELIGEFNNWQGELMNLEGTGGVHSYFSKKAGPSMLYKYRIFNEDGTITDKADPYGFGMELRPNSASKIVDLNTYKFSDAKWMKNRSLNYNHPMNIYEVHLGSWKMNLNNENGWYNYSEIVKELIDYCHEHHFTHIELLPLSEHPSDCSWGYQVSGFYAPTARYGEARDLMYFIDCCHNNGIGVIMDFVPVHFAVDDYGLCTFDGNALYEYPSTDTGYSEWGSYSFNYYRGEVCSFLQSAADYWLSVYHIDGLRIDAVSNIIYWKGDSHRGVNEGGVRFIKCMNEGLKSRHPLVMLIAEDSTAYEKVTAPIEYGGLSFDYKWDMGWMNDTLEYFKIPPSERNHHRGKLMFSMYYFYNELFLLPFSHDEVVHGKATILQKMWGDYEDKFLQARTLYTYMFTHPGKKLNFMGNEIGHFREWDEKQELDYMLLSYNRHDEFHRYFIKLCKIYANTKALYEDEYDSRKFRWLLVESGYECVFAYERIGREESIIVILNMSDKEIINFTFSYDKPAVMKRLLNSDSVIYGGRDSSKEECCIAKEDALIKGKYRFTLSLGRFSSKIFEVNS